MHLLQGVSLVVVFVMAADPQRGWRANSSPSRMCCFSRATRSGRAGADTGPAYGYHGYEYALTLGNLLRDVTAEETAWQSHH